MLCAIVACNSATHDTSAIDTSQNGSHAESSTGGDVDPSTQHDSTLSNAMSSTDDEASTGETMTSIDDPGNDSIWTDAKFDLESIDLPHDDTFACPTLQATIRDFAQSHPDFEDFAGSAATTGLVLPMLGADKKPVYAASGPTSQTTSAENFNQWYNDVSGINYTFSILIPLADVGNSTCSYANAFFFPIDGLGFGSEGMRDRNGMERNFLFTTEVHTSFVYRQGQVFTFIGDDDLWLFIDNRLAIDLGGLHSALEQSVELDTLGLEDGKVYTMDIFHAERHTDQSNFRIDSNISFIPPK